MPLPGELLSVRPVVRVTASLTSRSPRAAMVAAPVREMWLSIWGALPPGCPVLVRFFASALPAAAAGALVFAALPAAETLAGFSVPETGRRQR